MKKQLLAALLAVCLALALLPTYAMAFNAPDETAYWKNLTYENANAMARQMHEGTLTENAVLVAYGFNCPRSAQLVPKLPDFAAEKEVMFYGLGASALRLPPNFNYLITDWAALSSTPIVVTYNAATKTHTMRSGFTTTAAVEEQMRANGLFSDEGDTPAPPTIQLTDDASVTAEEWQVLRLVNQHRMSMNLQPLSVFDGLQKVANQRAYELTTRFAHERPDGSSCSTAYDDYHVTYTALAENIAKGQRTSEAAMNSWLNSSGHRANIESAAVTHLGVGYETASYSWSQNFAGAGCQFSDLRLSASSIEGKPSTALEDLLPDITVTAVCSRHGECRLPLIAAMCTGYDANAVNDQTLTVTYGGQTAALTITITDTGDDHTTHTWDDGVVTPPTCTDDGEITYTCTECGETKIEVGAGAPGHRFETVVNGEYMCENGCGTTIPAALEKVYETVKSADTLSVSYINAAEPEKKEKVEEYLTEFINAALQRYDITYSFKIVDGHFIDSTKYQYQIRFWRSDTRTTGYDLITEPLILVLKSAEEDSEETYYISVSKASGGEMIPNTRYAAAGERVTLSVHPDSGYTLDSVEVTDIRGRQVTLRSLNDDRYSFTMPSSRVTVDAAFVRQAEEAEETAVPGTDHTAQTPNDEVFTGLGTPGISGIVLNPVPMPFADVRTGDWFYNSVEYVWKHYLMSGVSETVFAPGETTSRAMIWTVLARMNNVRTDVNPGSTWYERGMLWAMEQGVTDGTNPMDNITREQLAAMLWRNAGSPSAPADLSAFSDSGNVSGYAQNAVRWAVANRILQGSDGLLNPQGTATRAEVSAMVARCADVIR